MFGSTNLFGGEVQRDNVSFAHPASHLMFVHFIHKWGTHGVFEIYQKPSTSFTVRALSLPLQFTLKTGSGILRLPY